MLCSSRGETQQNAKQHKMLERLNATIKLQNMCVKPLQLPLSTRFLAITLCS